MSDTPSASDSATDAPTVDRTKTPAPSEPLPTQPVSTNATPKPAWQLGHPTVALGSGASGTNPVFEELTNRTVAEFRILRRLGQGGMAEVYLAEQTSLHRQVALKVLRQEVLERSDDVLLKRFDQEAKAAAILNHPNIVQVHAVGEEDGVHFIAQEYVRGVNLRQYLARKGPPEAPLAVHIGKQVAQALQVAAEAGIVHRDIKPENVMITRKGRVKVADFGLAQLAVQGEKSQQLTQVGVTMGTPLYMSPEQVSGKPVDGRSDVYSFGVTLYQLLAGEAPFRGETALAIALQHLNETPPPLQDLRSDLPRSLCRLVHEMMAKRPEDRPDDASAVLTELKRIGRVLSDGEKGRPVPAGDRPSGTGFAALARDGWRDVADRVVLPLGTIAVVGILAAALGWLFRERSPLQAPVDAVSTIPRRPDVDEQMWDALRLGTEDAWQAVVRYFGEDPAARHEVAWARIRLGLIHVADQRFDEARKEFHAVRVAHPDEPKLAANAIAGIAVLDSLEGRFRDSQTLLLSEWKPIEDGTDPEMQPLVVAAVRRNARELGERLDERLQTLFEDDLRDPL